MESRVLRTIWEKTERARGKIDIISEQLQPDNNCAELVSFVGREETYIIKLKHMEF